jgi:flagellar basal-body rod protein FlgF
VDSGFYAACAGLRAQSQALDVVAANVANVSTGGYRAQQPTFRTVLAGASQLAAYPLNRAINNFGVLAGTRLDLSSTSMEPTGSELDLAVEGAGFFAIQTAAGVRYTKNGNFRLSPKRELITASGDAVLGEQGPLTLPAGQVSISSDGSVSVAGALAGKLRIAEFAPGAQLVPEGESYYHADGAGLPATHSRLRQGMLESSNVNPLQAAASLIAVQRQAEMMQRTLSIFHGEFNRIAATELSRV